MTFVVPLLLLATVFAFTNFLKQVSNRDWNAALTQLEVWAAGFAVVWLAAQSRLLGGFAFNAVPLRLLGIPDLIFIGVNIGSGGTLANELKKAFDRSDTAQTGPLFPRLAPPVLPSQPGERVGKARAKRPLRA